MQVEGRRTAPLGPGEGHAVRMPGGCFVTRRVDAEQTGGAYSLFEVEVGPGGSEPPHVQHREDECICVVEGRFEVLVEDERFEAGPGRVIYVPRGALHAFGNAGEEAARLLAIHTPGGTHEGFVEAAGELASGSGEPPSPGPGLRPEGFALLAAEYGVEVREATRTEREILR